MIAGLLLAAGAARRFGAPKLLEPLGGKAIIRWSADCLIAGGVDRLVVVVPPADESIAAALSGLDVQFVVNPEPERGMGSSIASGVEALPPDTRAVLVALADEPHTDPSVLERVLERYRQGNASVVVPRFEGTRGHPVLFDHTTFHELRRLTGEQGARSVADRDPARVGFVDIQAPKPIDVDTPADLARLRSSAGGASLIDRLMPEYDVRASYSCEVAASQPAVYRAIEETDLADSLITSALMTIRNLGRRGRDRSFRFRDIPARGPFFRLGEDPPREVVAGVMGRFWAITGNVCDGDRESFGAPLVPGTAKAAWNFLTLPSGGGTRLATETRVLCADEQSRRSFERYWRVVGPFSGLIRREALRLIRRQAQFTGSPPSPSP